MLDFVGPGGERITPSQLPPHGLKHCSVREKVLVVTAVRHGMLTFVEACERYDLSLEEFLVWQRTFDEAQTSAGGPLSHAPNRRPTARRLRSASTLGFPYLLFQLCDLAL